MRTLCSSTLIAEAMVIGFAGLVAMRLSDISTGTVWSVSGIAMVLCVTLCGLITRPGGVWIGWVLQGALIASGFVVPPMFALGVVFAVLWWAAVHYGRRIDALKAERAATQSAETA
ncbi:DUF4233 domain-containing protein [Wenjunlia tyrosinilytica]|jgi:hypothetical protein|uniref:Membrane protein n=1 Tax=Wenjunlia tyrosinilytica TaxID=1544741 RepID=A0A918DST7_9ACTN|nr:DUF4233 domain-containing protein [Wenjunlia tyrosinilytica]GGO80910.1 membrane protein [Wenjunlia tyrosinilytica]